MFMGFGLIFTLIAIAAIAYALGWRPQAQNNQPVQTGSSKSPLDIVKERYARGEISKVEYGRMRHELS
jgi:putative membrane protein